MGYKDPEKQKTYQAQWMKKRRMEWVSQKGPCPCGSTESLTLIKKTDSVSGDAHVWSLKEGQRKTALKNFIVMCRSCARKEKNRRMSEARLGQKGTALELNHADIWAIRGRLLGKESTRNIARSYGITHSTVSAIQTGKIWAWLKSGRRKVYGIKV